jgi:putative ABC transport system substrate-binding protein
VRRRKFILLLAGTALAWPIAATGQTPRKTPRVGYIIGSTIEAGRHIFEAFRQGLREQGYIEGQTIQLEVRWAEGHSERMRALVAELVDLNVDVLVVGNSTAALAAKNATQTIPIVMFAGDPVGLGLVASLARPGGNVTGLSYFNAEVTSKRLELMKELVLGLTRVAVLRNPTIASHAVFWQETEVAAGKLGITLRSLEVRRPEDFEAAFAAATRNKAEALLAFDDPPDHCL